MTARGPLRVLYLAYWGLAEPLGQSLILPALERLAARDVQLTLVTFEKPRDWQRTAERLQLRDQVASLGVRWVPLRYHRVPKVPATAFDLFQGCARGLLARLRSRFDIIHARTYVGGLIGMMLAPLLRAKLIYHNEGFYPDEQVDGGVWRFEGRPHRIAKALEQGMYARADGIITLSRRARTVVEDLPAVARKRTPVIVVPSCVDLERFATVPGRTVRRDGVFRLVYTGTIGGRYIFDQVGRFVAEAQRALGPVALRVLTRTEPDVVAALLRTAGASPGSWSIASVPHAAMPGALAGHDAGLFFLTQGISAHGCSPTKIGEYWALGLPVVTTPHVSDTDEIIRRDRVGVVVADHTATEHRRAAEALAALLHDPELSGRCRQAAETHYGLEAACDRQRRLYDAVL